MVERHIHRLVVTQGRQPVGMITSMDLLRGRRTRSVILSVASTLEHFRDEHAKRRGARNGRLLTPTHYLPVAMLRRPRPKMYDAVPRT